MTIFLRLLADTRKDLAITEACFSLRSGLKNDKVFQVAEKDLRIVPGIPFAYWISSEIRSHFQSLERFGDNGRSAQHGCSTKDDNRFVRLSWEIQNTGDKWFPYAKGGAFSPFYQDIIFLINWHKDAKELEAALLKKFPYLGDTANWVLHRESSYFSPGLKWPLRASAFAPQVMPRGVIFSGRSYAAFANQEDLLWLLALMNSRPFDYIFKILLGRFGFPEFLVGTLQMMPLPELTEEHTSKLDKLAKRAFLHRRKLDTIEECSHAFTLPAVLRTRIGDYDLMSIELDLGEIQSEIDEIAFDLYGFSEADRAAALGSAGAPEEECSEGAKEPDDSEEDKIAEAIDQTDGLLSWTVGVAFGRFDWRLATGEREAPTEPDPFDPLPAKSPGMLPDHAVPFHDQNGILVDDKGHPHDLPQLIEEVLARVKSDAPGDVRRWLQRDFFPLHLKQYSKSRRKAPIYWPISTHSGSYTLWLYYPSLSSQTLYSAVNDFVEPKLEHVSRDTATLRDKGAARSRDDERAFEALQALELELIELRDILLQIAPTYRPNHDDGVQITAAPLWQLFRHKPWQKILKDTWAKLGKGDYDWAHLAMAYWPDRVREKCKTDKSLAIAHDLEHLYVEPAITGKKCLSAK